MGWGGWFAGEAVTGGTAAGGRSGSERRPAAQQLGGVLWIGAEAGGRRVVAGRGGSIGWLLRSNLHY